MGGIGKTEDIGRRRGGSLIRHVAEGLIAAKWRLRDSRLDAVLSHNRHEGRLKIVAAGRVEIR
jgi:hypothetical protein